MCEKDDKPLFLTFVGINSRNSVSTSKTGMLKIAIIAHKKAIIPSAGINLSI